MSEKVDRKKMLEELERVYVVLRMMKERQDREYTALTKEILSLFRGIRSTLPVDPVMAALAAVEEDELYPEAHRLVVRAGMASASYLQRKLGIGYARAAKLIDMLEENGVVESRKDGKPREIVLQPAAVETLKNIEAQLKQKQKPKK